MAVSDLPILLVAAGSADQADLARFQAAVPRARVEWLSGAGHDLCRDQPLAVGKMVGEWLHRSGGG